MIDSGKKYNYVIIIPSMENRLHTISAIFDSFISKLQIRMLATVGPNGDPIATPSVFTTFGGYVKQIT